MIDNDSYYNLLDDDLEEYNNYDDSDDLDDLEEYNNYDDSWANYGSSNEKYGHEKWSDDVIDDAFEGDPTATWGRY